MTTDTHGQRINSNKSPIINFAGNRRDEAEKNRRGRTQFAPDHSTEHSR